MTAENKPLAVHAAIVQVMDEVGKEGVGKNHTAEFGGAKRNYRGIDDIYNALNRAMVRAKIAIIPSVVEKTVERFERENQYKKMVTTHVYSMVIDYKVICAIDSSFEIMRIFIEGFDTSDKGTGKAFSYAYKCGVLQLFCIPVEGQEDQDAHDPKIERDKPPAPAPERRPTRTENERVVMAAATERGIEVGEGDTSPIIDFKGHPLCGQHASKLDSVRLVKFVRALQKVGAGSTYLKSVIDYAATRGITDFSDKAEKRTTELAAAVGGKLPLNEDDLHTWLHPDGADIRPEFKDIRAWVNAEHLVEYGAWLEKSKLDDRRERMLRVEACLNKLFDAEAKRADEALAAAERPALTG